MVKPRVAVVTPGTFAVPSNYNSSVERVVEQVSERLKNEVNFYIFSIKMRNLPGFEYRAGITHIRPAKNGYVSKVERWLHMLSPDVIQVENRPRLAETLKKKCRNVPVWLSLHSVRFMSPPHISAKRLRRCLKYADRIIVNSEFLKGMIVRVAPSASPKISVNYPGVDPQTFVSRWSPEGQVIREAMVRELGYQHKKIILFIGRLIKIKGVHHLLEIMPDLAAAYPDCVLVVVGGAFYGSTRITPYVARLHKMGNRLPGHVRFVPFTAHNEIHRWLCLADIVVVPSFAAEAFGLVNAEAMAAGVPVIATDAGGIKEIVEHEKTGFLLQPHSLKEELLKKIVLLLHDEELCRKMGEAGAERAARYFTWEHTADRFRKLYKESLHTR
jgi:spore coat protein SA